MSPMAAIPESTRNSITLRLLDHAEAHWPQLTLSTLTLLSRGVAQVIEQGLVLFCFTRWFCWLSCRRAGRVVFWVGSWVRS